MYTLIFWIRFPSLLTSEKILFLVQFAEIYLKKNIVHDQNSDAEMTVFALKLKDAEIRLSQCSSARCIHPSVTRLLNALASTVLGMGLVIRGACRDLTRL